MKTRPILFSTDMVTAILNGSKSQTRRVMKQQPSGQVQWDSFGYSALTPDNHIEARGMFEDGYGSKFFKTPYNIGDIMWVRETWQLTHFLHPSDDNYGYVYKASDNGSAWQAYDEAWTWKPSIFMPKSACRLFLQITHIRIQRLHQISYVDAFNEGVEIVSPEGAEIKFKDYTNPDNTFDHSFYSFRSLWCIINGIQAWRDNPFVWVYDFKVVDRPDSFI